MTVNEMAKCNECGGSFGSDYMLGYFADYVNDWTLLDDPDRAKDMLCCIHNGFSYRKGLIQQWNTDEEFNFFDTYGLLENDFVEVTSDTFKYKIRFFKKDFIDTFTNEDWYFKSLEEEAEAVVEEEVS